MDTEFKSTHAVKTWCIVEQQRSKLVVGHPDPLVFTFLNQEFKFVYEFKPYFLIFKKIKARKRVIIGKTKLYQGGRN